MEIRKRILVTGGAGFLGSHLCEHLVAEGHDILCVDNDFTGAKSKSVYQELPEDDPARRCPDITLAEAHLGWEPSVAPSAGPTKTIAYFDSII